MVRPGRHLLKGQTGDRNTSRAHGALAALALAWPGRNFRVDPLAALSYCRLRVASRGKPVPAFILYILARAPAAHDSKRWSPNTASLKANHPIG